MLVIERRVSSAVYIGNDIRVKVVRCGRRRVWLGIDAPRAVPVRREELPPARAQGGTCLRASAHK